MMSYLKQIAMVVVGSALITLHFSALNVRLDNYHPQAQESRRVSNKARDFVFPTQIVEVENKIKRDLLALQVEEEKDHHHETLLSAGQDEKMTEQQLQSLNKLIEKVYRVEDYKFHWSQKTVALDRKHRPKRLLEETTNGGENIKQAFQKSPTDSTVRNLLQTHNMKSLDRKQQEKSRTLHTCTFVDDSGDRQNATFPVTPHLIIAGVAKAGTTALVNLLRLHPMLKKSRGEAHFFDQNLYLQQNLHRLDDDQVMCEIRRQYADKWNWSEEDVGKLFYEKTPRYVILPDLPEVIQKVCPWNPKIIIMLRDPIERLESHHKMNLERDRGTAGLSLDQAIENEVAILRELGLTTAPLLSEVSEKIDQEASDSSTVPASWFEIPQLSTEERKRISRILYKDVVKSHKTIMERGIYAAQLEPWLQNFKIGESLLVIQHERFRSDPVTVFNQVQDFLEVSRYKLSKDVFLRDYSPNKGSFREVVSNTTLKYLRNFYRPYNEQLADLLGEEWRGVWKS